MGPSQTVRRRTEGPYPTTKDFENYMLKRLHGRIFLSIFVIRNVTLKPNTMTTVQSNSELQTAFLRKADCIKVPNQEVGNPLLLAGRVQEGHFIFSNGSNI
jgi:hypothetical protein